MTAWTRLDIAVAVVPFVVLAGLAVWAVRAQRPSAAQPHNPPPPPVASDHMPFVPYRVYPCRARGCDRKFADPLERSSHYRKAHLS